MCYVKAFYKGYPTCKARKLLKHRKEINKNLTQDMCNVTRTAEDAIINCLKEDEPSWENVFHIPDSTLEKEKLYYNQG